MEGRHLVVRCLCVRCLFVLGVQVTVQTLDNGVVYQPLSFIATLEILVAKTPRPPSVTNQVFSVVENSSPDTFVGMMATIQSGVPLTYTITGGNTNSVFRMQNCSGECGLVGRASGTLSLLLLWGRSITPPPSPRPCVCAVRLSIDSGIIFVNTLGIDYETKNFYNLTVTVLGDLAINASAIIYVTGTCG